jgi:hypothetical protein
LDRGLLDGRLVGPLLLDRRLPLDRRLLRPLLDRRLLDRLLPLIRLLLDRLLLDRRLPLVRLLLEWLRLDDGRLRQLGLDLRRLVIVVVIVHQALGLGLEDAQRATGATCHLGQLLAPEQQEDDQDDDDQLGPAKTGYPRKCEVHVASFRS